MISLVIFGQKRGPYCHLTTVPHWCIAFSGAIPNLVVVAEDVEESHEVFMKLDGETPPPEPPGADPTSSESGCCGFSILA